jgi:hypothetical protein
MFFTRKNGTAEPITELAKVDSDLSSFYERQYQLSKQVDKVVPGLQYLGGPYSPAAAPTASGSAQLCNIVRLGFSVQAREPSRF